MQYLLSFEIVSFSFYLTKDGSLQKSPKSELAREVKNLLEESCPATVPESEESKDGGFEKVFMLTQMFSCAVYHFNR